MPESATDRILDLLDAGLQSSAETGYGTDRDTTACARCLRNSPAEGGDLCPGCRAFLLGDAAEDPALRERRGVLAENVRVVRLDEDGNTAGPSVAADVAADGLVTVWNCYDDDTPEVSFAATRCAEPDQAVQRTLTVTFCELTNEARQLLLHGPAPFRIVLHVPDPSGPRWEPIRSGDLARLCDTVDTYRHPAGDGRQTVQPGPAVVVEETQVRLTMCGTCGCPAQQVTVPEPEPFETLADPFSRPDPFAQPSRLLVEPCGHEWTSTGTTPAFELWARPIADLPAVAAWAARWLHRFDHAARHGSDPTLGMVDRIVPSFMVEGAAQPDTTGPWQNQAMTHLQTETDHEAQLVRVVVNLRALAEAVGLDRTTATRIRDEELIVAGHVPDQAVRERVLRRAELAAKGLDPGPPGEAGTAWRMLHEPRADPEPADRQEFWWRRAHAAASAVPAGAPLWVTPDEHDEIRRLFPDWPVRGVSPYQQGQDDDGRTVRALFGARLEVLLVPA